MEGYDVISVADDKKIGTVVREEGGYVVFEHGALRKQHHAIPSTTIEVDLEELGRHFGTSDTAVE